MNHNLLKLAMRTFIFVLMIYLVVALSVFCGEPVDRTLPSGESGINYDQHGRKPEFPEKLMSYLDTGQYIVYAGGHHGSFWVAISRDSSGFTFHSDNIFPYDSKSRDYYPFDTAAFVTKFKEILDWGFDSLPILSKHVQSIIPQTDTYVSSRTTLTVVKNQTIQFETDSRKHDFISGSDSINFSRKLKRLYNLMYYPAWIGDRSEIATPDEVFESILKKEIREDKKRMREEKKQLSNKKKSLRQQHLR